MPFFPSLIDPSIAVTTARDLYYYANELKDYQNYEKAIQYYNAFLDTKEGWIEDELSACWSIVHCYHELARSFRPKDERILENKAF